MSNTKLVVCDVCNGDGEVEVWDYNARDVQFGTNDVPEHTVKVRKPCGSCMGKGGVREDKLQ